MEPDGDAEGHVGEGGWEGLRQRLRALRHPEVLLGMAAEAGFRIRDGTEEDVGAVLPMVAAICQHHQELDPERYGFVGQVAEMYRSWLPQRVVDPRSVFLVADAEGSLVGFVVGACESNIRIYTLREFGFIHDVWVEPAWRGQGIAGALVDEAIERFAAMGVTQVRLETAAENEAARRLFASRGFRVGTVDMLRVLG